ncbi:MAG: hypothetical protein ACKO84_05675, partial [Actinomycetota bacterium]
RRRSTGVHDQGVGVGAGETVDGHQVSQLIGVLLIGMVAITRCQCVMGRPYFFSMAGKCDARVASGLFTGQLYETNQVHL